MAITKDWFRAVNQLQPVLSLFCCTMVLLVSTSTQAALTAHFKFDETSGAPIDTTGNVTGATLIGAPFQGSSTAVDGLAIVLDDPNEGINLTTNAAVAPTDNFTLTMFVRQDPGQVAFARLLDATGITGSLSTDAGFRIQSGGGTEWRLLVEDGIVQNRQIIGSPTTVQDNTWYFLAARYSSSGDLAMSVLDVNLGGSFNAADVAAATGTAASLHGPIMYTANYNATRLGVLYSEDSAGFQGAMDDVRFYDNVLSDAELATLASIAPPSPVIEIDRLTGTIDLINHTIDTVPIKGYSITSEQGALVQANWLTVSDNYDRSGNGMVDMDEDWFVLTNPTSKSDFSESSLNGGSIATPKTIRLGDPGAWLGNPIEDLEIELLLADGTLLGTAISFVGNGGESFNEADLNTDGSVNATDWLIFRGNLNGPALAGDSSLAELFREGDFDRDFDVDRSDFLAYKTAYNAANGAGAFIAMIQSVPEPSSWMLLLFAGVALAWHRCGVRLTRNSDHASWVQNLSRGDNTVTEHQPQIALAFIAVVMGICLLAFSTTAQAQTTFTDGAAADSEIATAGNWDNGLPDNVGNSGTVPTGFATTATGPAASGGGSENDLDGMIVTFEGNSTLASTNNRSDDNALTFNDTSVWTNDANLYLGRDGPAGSSATLNINDSAVVNVIPRLTNAAGGRFGVGRIGDGFVVQSGGSVTVDDQIDIGDLNGENGGSGLYTLSAGTVEAEFLAFNNVTAGVTSSLDFTVSSTGVVSMRNGGADYTTELEGFITAGDITIGGAQAQISDFVIIYDGSVQTSLSLPGALPDPLGIVVNTTTGEVTLTNPESTPVAIDYYEIRSATGDLVVGSTPGDYNSDGTTNAPDFTVWRDTLGSTSDLRADGDGSGEIDAPDYDFWKANFGETSGTGWNSLQDQDLEGNGPPGDGNGWEEGDTVSDSLLFETYLAGSSEITNGADISLGNAFATGGTETLTFEYHVAGTGDVFAVGDVSFVASGSLNGAAVPEPSALALLLASLVGLALTTRRRSSSVPVVGTALLALLAISPLSHGARTLDRDYKLGDESGEGAVVTNDVGSGNIYGLTYDGIGEGGDAFDLNDLTPRGEGGLPKYANVTGRPLLNGGGTIGIEFDGVDDYLQGRRLGFPETSIAATGGDVMGSHDYDGISNRGFQFWVHPDGAGNGSLQSLVMDTNQHGAQITAAGTWSMRYDGDDIDSGVAVAFDQWHHVMVVRPFGGGATGGSRMYVDGVFVAAEPGGYTNADDADLVVGANTAGDAINFTGGTAEFFDGTIDALELFVLGTSTTTSTPYGEFDLAGDNEVLADFLSGKVDGDLAGDDDIVQGDGSGGPLDDVAVFIDNWLSEKTVNGFTSGDVTTWAKGDFNLDGRTTLLDWELLSLNHVDALNLNLGELLAARHVPEPSTWVLSLLLSGSFILKRRDWVTC